MREYREVRAAIREGLVQAIDSADRLYKALQRGDIAEARLYGDDLTAITVGLCDNLVWVERHLNERRLAPERSAQ